MTTTRTTEAPTIDKQPLAVIPAGIGGIGSADQQPEDVRFVKDGVARALQTLQANTSPEPDDQVAPLSPQMVGLRFTADHRARGCGAVSLRPRVAAEGLRKAITHEHVRGELTGRAVAPAERACSAR